MNILLLANYLNDGQESMQRFAAMMADGLTHAGHEVRTIRPQSVAGRLRPAGHGVGKYLGYVDKFAAFPAALKTAAKWADLVHICDHSNSFYTKHLGSVAHVLTCHDLLAVRSALGEIPEAKTRWSGRQLQRMIVEGLKRTQHVVCVSEATRKDLLRITGIPEKGVSRIYNALNYPYSPMARQECESRLTKLFLDPNQPFLLHVGGNHWYKNRLGVLRIFAALKRHAVSPTLKLVMAGKPWTPEMRHFAIEAGIADFTVELNDVSNEDLRALYSSASLLLFPSLQEGFGWPIIEAQACGCPVFTSDRSPMDEVGGEAAAYVNPEDTELGAQAVKHLLENPHGLRESGLRNAARFSTSRMIESYVAVYERVRGAARDGKAVRVNRKSAFVSVE